jgi:hypothetical protein
MNLLRIFKPVPAALFACFVILSFFGARAYGTNETIPELLIFYSPSCHRCLQIKHEVLPSLETRFKGTVVFRYLDISETDNFKRLVNLQQKHAPDLAIKVPLFFLNGRFLNGENVTAQTLRSFIDEARALEYRDLPAARQEDRVSEFHFLAVAGAGLVDGINPCAFTVIIFFLSFLSLQGYRRRHIAVVGAGFILAVLVTYILIGLGIFNFFYRLERFYSFARAFNIGIGFLSIIFGFLAVYDLFLFFSTRSTERFSLQLPKAVKDRIHFIIGRYYRRDKRADPSSRGVGGLCLASFVTGFLVCLLEAVCTGQMYVPTITFIIKGTPQRLLGLWYLALYNLMFVLPLVFILLLALAGVSSISVGNFFRKHIAAVKVLMAVFFFALGIYLVAGR